jgi:hypothetical protein
MKAAKNIPRSSIYYVVLPYIIRNILVIEYFNFLQQSLILRQINEICTWSVVKSVKSYDI